METSQPFDNASAMPPPPPPPPQLSSNPETKQPPSLPPPSTSSLYSPPTWATSPPTIPFSFEVMKQGTMLSKIDLRQLCIHSNKGHLSLGRAPDNDILLDHTSSSRLHCILEFNTTTSSSNGAASPVYLFDPGSTHGTFVNKVRVTPKHHTAVQVGDHIRFGESSRTYIICGPPELMVEEGPSREEGRQAVAVEALRRRKEMDALAAKQAMQRAIGSHVEEEREENVEKEVLDWKTYAATKPLTEKQQKIADKIRKKENRIVQLQRECEKIESKHRSTMEELTVGQANALAKNEEEVERLTEEIEDLEDQLVESITDSIRGAKRGGGGEKKRKVKKKGDDDDDDDNNDDDDDDIFYDRTKMKRKKYDANSGGTGRKKTKEEESIDAASLYGQLQLLLKEREGKRLQLQERMDNGIMQHKEEEKEKDALDAFMQEVGASLENAPVAALRQEVAHIEEEIAKTEGLLLVADPDEYYKPGSKAAENAVQRARKMKALAVGRQRQRKEAETRMKMKEVEDEKRKREQEMVVEVEEEEEEEEVKEKEVGRKEGNDEEKGGKEEDEYVSTYEARRTEIAAALQHVKKKENTGQGSNGDIVETEDSPAPANEDDNDDVVWHPPADQTGDGRIALNDRLGY